MAGMLYCMAFKCKAWALDPDLSLENWVFVTLLGIYFLAKMI